MLTITIPGREFFDEEKSVFVSVDGVTLELEHSLISLSKWESLWEKPFLGKDEKTSEEIMSYIECMVLTPKIPPEVFSSLSNENLQAINDYINRKMTATWFNEAKKSSSSSEVITAELIYYWLVALKIPFECESWHLERLFTLIKVASVKSTPGKKMAGGDLAAERRALNAQRKAELGTRG